MSVYLGLDIGSNSVGSAWVDLATGEISAGVSVFPAGVEEGEEKRGAPKNQARRERRSQRRSIRRRALRKMRLRQVLAKARLLPDDKAALEALFQTDPWLLRREGLDRSLTPHEFGRVLVHLGQRRGALGIEPSEEGEEGKMKEAIAEAERLMAERNMRTFGQLMSILRAERVHSTPKGREYEDAIRNRRGVFKFHATRAMVRGEFELLWNKQRELGGPLAQMLTDELKRSLDDPEGDETWRSKGALFEQRRTFWDQGALGHCDLEPSDHKCPIGDRHAQAFRVLETVNNIRIQKRNEPERPLDAEERAKVIAALRTRRTASPATIRKALGLDRREVKAFYTLNIERDEQRELNTDWFYREIILGAFGEEGWSELDEKSRESVNRALLRFDPQVAADVDVLRAGAQAWWGLDQPGVEKLLAAWNERPNPGKRVNLSRRAIINLLPYLERGATVTEARQQFSEDPGSAATPEQRARYAFTLNKAVADATARRTGAERAGQLLSQRGLNQAARRFIEKHPDTLPPPPMLANPVVRKAIYEVRRHVNAYLRRLGRKPDRIVIELAREAYQTAKVRNAMLTVNRRREAVRKKIIQEFGLGNLSESQRLAAVERVLLCRLQKGVCPYSDPVRTFSGKQAAEGQDCEVDHIVPRSKGGDNGLNNLVLCARGSNREKGNRTPREWLGADAFEKVLQRMGHLDKSRGSDDGYFAKRDCKRKWDNLNATVSPEQEKRWRESQLTSTAYAATQVAEYLHRALYRDEPHGTRRIFFTNGRYTAMLRRDWQLFETGGVAGSDEDRDARPRLGKGRTDHRHHAVDAVVIALTGPEIVQQAATAYAWQEEQKALTGSTPKRPAILPPAPWKTAEVMRDAVMRRVFGGGEGAGGLLVCHRPVKRKLVGALHEETALGVVSKEANLYVKRIPVEELTGKRLRMADDRAGRSGAGPVRDRALRKLLRDILAQNGIDPDAAAKTDFRRLEKEGKFRMPSGVPIRTVKVLQTIGDPVVLLKRGQPDERRVYESGNNHHIEIVADEKTGEWDGEIVRAFDAARRVRPPSGEPRRPLINKSHGPGRKFVISLAEGETIFSRRQDLPEQPPQHYVVAKLTQVAQGKRIFFKRPDDARMAKDQDRWSVSPKGLRELGPSPGTPPYKVRVSPLGEVERASND